MLDPKLRQSPDATIGRVGAPQYTDVPFGMEPFFANVTISGGVAPARAYIEELLPDILEGRMSPARSSTAPSTSTACPTGTAP